MIVRPLELQSRLRPAPRSLDGLFFVNVGLLGLFFVLFGSRFVASPGLSAEPFLAPAVGGARSGSAPTTHTLRMDLNGQLYDRNGVVFPEEVVSWMSSATRESADPSLLILADTRVPVGEVNRLAGQAYEAGFRRVISAANDTRPVR
jgi:biopolymer transport protein ExbD